MINRWLPTMTLHDLFTLLNLPIGTSGHDITQPLPKINVGVQYIRYTSEYILKLQLHQHSLLTRKVFSRHKLSAQFFFSYHLDHHQIFVIFIWIYIITRSVSSSLDLYHHSIWIITIGSSLVIITGDIT